MKEHESEEARTETAVNLALGLLDQSERARLDEHLRSGCTACEAEVLSFAQVAGALAMSANAVEPPRRLRGHLLEAIARLSATRDKGGMQAWKVVHAAAFPWQSTKRQGIWEKSLLHDPVRRRSTRIIRMDPGAEIPAHRHLGDEESLVLEGAGTLGGSTFGPGDYHRAPSGSFHPSYSSEKGCVFLLFSGTEYEFPATPLEASRPEQFKTVRSTTGTWTPVRAGLHVQTLFSTSTPPLEGTSLLRVSAGGAVSTLEFDISEVYFLEGSARLGPTELSAGDYVRTTDDGQPGEFESQQGCTLIIRSHCKGGLTEQA